VRKLVTISSAAAAAVATTVVAAYAAGGDEPARARATAKSPTGPIVLKQADAVAPRKGSDYHLLVKLGDRNARNAEEVTTSSEVVIGRRSGDLLLDPVSGHRTHLPDAGDVLDATDETVTFLRSKPGDPRPHMARLDRASGLLHRFTLPEVPGRQHYTVLGLDGDTVWFKNGDNLNHTSLDRVWSVRFGHPGTLERHGRRSSPAFADGVLAWVERSSDGPDVVAMQDAAGGEIRRAACRRTAWSDRRSATS
jgi:hypothetical protein